MHTQSAIDVINSIGTSIAGKSTMDLGRRTNARAQYLAASNEHSCNNEQRLLTHKSASVMLLAV